MNNSLIWNQNQFDIFRGLKVINKNIKKNYIWIFMTLNVNLQLN